MTDVLPDPHQLRTAADGFSAAAQEFQAQANAVDTAGTVTSTGAWTGTAADGYRGATRQLRDYIAAGRPACDQAADELRGLASLIEGIAPHHAQLVSQRQALDGHGVVADVETIFQKARLDDAIRLVEAPISAKMTHIANELDRLTNGAALAKKEAHDNSFWVKLGHGIADTAKSVGKFTVGLVEGFVSASAGLLKLAWKVSFIRAQIDPIGYAKDMAQLGAGFAALGTSLWKQPGATLYKVFDINALEHDPGRWVGEQLPAVIAGIATGGAGVAAGAATDGTTIITEGAAVASAELTEQGLTDASESIADAASRRVALWSSTREAIQDAAPKTPDGDFIDPNTGQVIPRSGPFDYGHRPGYEWWRTQQSARSQGWTREQVIQYENDATHYQIEDPSTNRSHKYELP